MKKNKIKQKNKKKSKNQKTAKLFFIRKCFYDEIYSVVCSYLFYIHFVFILSIEKNDKILKN